jgi:hypothetical protein
MPNLLFGGGGCRVVEWLQSTLRAWDRLGHTVWPAELLDRLVIRPGDPEIIEDRPSFPRVRLFATSMEDNTGCRHSNFVARTGLTVRSQ